MGIAFDIGHATLEGGLSWPIQARLAEPRYSVVYVKDFRWEKQAKGWEPVWCALGEGMVSSKFFEMLARSDFAGPVCQHHEYEIGTTPAENLRHFKEDSEDAARLARGGRRDRRDRVIRRRESVTADYARYFLKCAVIRRAISSLSTWPAPGSM